MDREKHNKYNREWAKRNRKKVNFFHQRWQNKRKEWYFSLKKGKGCKMCGESHPACLDFHHKNPKTKEGLVRNLAISSSNDKRVLKEIRKCILICANCHRKIHYKGENGHGRKNLPQ